MLKITGIDNLKFNDQDGAVKAYVDITFNDVLKVAGARIVEGKNGYFVGMPSIKKKGEDKFHDVVTFSDSDFKKEMNDKVLKVFHDSRA